MSPDLKRPDDHEQRLEAVRRLAIWELGHPGWADRLISEYFENPAESAARMVRRRRMVQ